MQKTNKIDDLIDGLKILRLASDNFEFEVINRSFPGGAPDHSSKGYLAVPAFSYEFNETAVKRLRQLGWHSEQDGDFWCFNLG